MKQFSILLNVLLLLAVGFLYYIHFSHSSNSSSSAGSLNYKFHDSSNCDRISVAYVELDSLNNNVNFIKQRKKELDAEQRVIMNEYENAYRSMTQLRDDFIKRGKSITQQEAEAFQEKLGIQQQQIEQVKQQKSQQLAEKGARVMGDMQGKLKDFMNEYNKNKKFTMIFTTGTGLDYFLYKDVSLDITSEIVKGLNEKMK
jgi:outer membrane protein